jgi:hypothetical protein
MTINKFITLQVMFTAVKGDPTTGYATIDSITFKTLEDSLLHCETIPNPSPTTTPAPPSGLTNCTFDGDDGTTPTLCGWKVHINNVSADFKN